MTPEQTLQVLVEKQQRSNEEQQRRNEEQQKRNDVIEAKLKQENGLGSPMGAPKPSWSQPPVPERNLPNLPHAQKDVSRPSFRSPYAGFGGGTSGTNGTNGSGGSGGGSGTPVVFYTWVNGVIGKVTVYCDGEPKAL